MNLAENITQEEINSLEIHLLGFWEKWDWVAPMFNIIIRFLNIIFIIVFIAAIILFIASFFTSTVSYPWYQYIILAIASFFLFNYTSGFLYYLADGEYILSNMRNYMVPVWFNILVSLSLLGFIYFNDILLNTSFMNFIDIVVGLLLILLLFIEKSFDNLVIGEASKILVDNLIENINKEESL